MAVLFRSKYDIDQKYWVPLLKEKLGKADFRVWPDDGDKNDIEYLICWDVAKGDEESYPNLKAVISLRAGVERFIGNPDFPSQAKLVRMIDPGMTDSMAEFVGSFVLRFHRDHDDMEALTRKHPWPLPIPKRAEQRTVGFLGYGVLAQASAQKIKSMGFQLQCWRNTMPADPDIKTFVGKDGLNDFLASTEILVCLLPLTKNTENILDKNTISKLPEGASIINAARGAHIVDEYLIDALTSGKIKYAALDVFREEPLPLDHPYLSPAFKGRVIATPHIAAVTMPDTGSEVIVETIKQLENGETPEGLVDLQKGY